MLTDAKSDAAGQSGISTLGAPAGDASLAGGMLSAPAVTMLCWCYYPHAGGGADRVMQQVAEFLVRRGGQVTVLTKTFSDVPKKDAVNGVAVRRVFTLEIPRLRFFSYMTSAFFHQLFHRDPCQVLHVNQFYLFVPLAIWLRRRRGMRVVVEVHGSGLAGDVPRLDRLPLGLGRLVLRAGQQADAFISLTRQITEELAAVGIARERINQIPNGVDCARFTPTAPAQRAALRTQLSLPPDRPIVFFSGRLSAEKAVDVLLRAWQRARARCPEALLVVAGDGPLRAEMEALARELGLEESVRFLGWVEQVLPFYQAADVFVLSSWSEGMSIALLEAMACGLAPVVTAIPGNVDVVAHERNGLLVPAGDAEALAAALARPLNDADLRAQLAAAAIHTVRADFSLERMLQRYTDLYQRLAQSAPGRRPQDKKERRS